ncbi:MAG: TetR/AcrR family transcriptional regulator [Rothia mucilaginosa]|nr:MAG: TetR/AcrR family transcriptional regulator [Rothia mucilaginosa]
MANLVESPANITDKRSARKAENRIAIVEAAESLILEGGYGALNAEALAERAGVSRRTIFNHFASVDDVLITRMNQYFNRIFEECDFTVSGENASMEAEMLSIARKVFKSNTLEEYIAPFAHLLYALEMDSPAKFEEYSHVIYPDLPYLRVAVFASNLAETIGEGVYYYLTRAEEVTAKVAAEAPEGTHPEALAIEAMRQCVLEALDYLGRLVQGEFAS